MGPVGWIYLAEIVPSRIRAKAFSIFTAINWGSNLFIGLFTLTTIDMMGARLLPTARSEREQRKAGVAGLYAVFAGVCVLCVAFIFLFVNETMGKSLEELNTTSSTTEGFGGGAGALLGRQAGEYSEAKDSGYPLLAVEVAGVEEGEGGGSGEGNSDGRVAL